MRGRAREGRVGGGRHATKTRVSRASENIRVPKRIGMDIASMRLRTA